MKITFWFILGIVFSYYFNPNPTTSFIITGIFFVPFIVTLYLSKRDFIQKIYFGFATYLLFFQIGSCTQVINNEFYDKENYVHLIKNETDYHYVELVLREKLKGSSSIDKYIGLVKKVDDPKKYVYDKNEDFHKHSIYIIFFKDWSQGQAFQMGDNFMYGCSGGWESK